MDNSDNPTGDTKIFTAESIQDQLKFLDRAHRMSCSDPNDPTKTTSYSVSAAIIRQLMTDAPNQGV